MCVCVCARMHAQAGLCTRPPSRLQSLLGGDRRRREAVKHVWSAELPFPFQGPLGPSVLLQVQGCPGGHPGPCGVSTAGSLFTAQFHLLSSPSTPLPRGQVASSVLVSLAWVPLLPGWGASPACQGWRRGSDQSSQPPSPPSLQDGPGPPIQSLAGCLPARIPVCRHQETAPLVSLVHLFPVPPPTLSPPVPSLSHHRPFWNAW